MTSNSSSPTNVVQMSSDEFKLITVTYSVNESRFGLCLVATTEKGVCCILFADTKTEVEHDLKSRFPHGTFIEKVQPSHELVRACIGSSVMEKDISYHVYGTAFQHQVWNAVRSIPYGMTMSYGDVATMLRDKSLSRAVGSAIALNPIGYIVPCHRVISSTRKLTGFRWGLERKQHMLNYENITFKKA